MLEPSKKRDKLVKEKAQGSEKSNKMWQTREKNWQVTEKKGKKWDISEKMSKASVKRNTKEWEKVTIKDKPVNKDAK